MLSVTYKPKHAERHYVKCCYVECLYAECRSAVFTFAKCYFENTRNKDRETLLALSPWDP
jgi:hypothetical protein